MQRFSRLSGGALDPIERLEMTKRQTIKYFALGDEKLSMSYAEGKWSVRFILHHLADAETVLYERVRRVISEPKSVIWAFTKTDGRTDWTIREPH